MTENQEAPQENTSGQPLVPANQARPQRIYLLPMNHRPFMPGLIQPVLFSKERWDSTMERVSKTPHHMLGLVYTRDRDTDELDSSDFPDYGCLARVHGVSGDNDTFQMISQGLARFRITGWLSRKPPYLVEVEYPEIEDAKEREDEKIKAYALAIINTIKELLPLNPLYNEGLKAYLQNFSPRDPSPLTDFAAALTTASGDELQQVLETLPLLPRMEKVLVLVRKELEVAQLQSHIMEEVNEKVSKQQREFFLREQMKVIQRELGLAKDDRSADIDAFNELLQKHTPPDTARTRIDEELKKLSILEPGSPEYAVTRNWLDWACGLPWGQLTADNLDLEHARTTLEANHAGLSDIKDRIIEFLALAAIRGEMRGSILLLVGPPGVGKTSIGRAIAEALERKFFRLSLGGMRDEAEIKGHRRTYIGALPGKLVQALKETGSFNPVILLDEIDKLGSSYQGDPASALLEVLDPEQNNQFLDHYLDLRLDLSRTLFICTANTLDSIPQALLDRMEVIRLPGYIHKEKVAIAKQHLWPKALKQAGIRRGQLKLADSALNQIIEGYAREAGVRNLEKQLNRIIRKSAVKLLAGDKQVSVTAANLPEFLGEPYFRKEKLQKGIGVVTGLAWTAMGGATLAIEASRVHNGSRGFKQTGQLGAVMKESSEIAYSYVASHLDSYGGTNDWFKDAFIHLHVPEGATPKDGPSAGVTMATALVSLATGRAIKRKLAMTGELTLTGQVLAVGGIREKIIAARRVGIFELILPEACRRDYDELPAYLKEGLTVHFAEHYKDVYRVVFE